MTAVSSKAPSGTPKLEFRTAWHALQELIKNPEDTTHVFTIIKALTGKSLWRQYRRFSNTETGARVLEEEIDLLDTLIDHEALAKLPEGSLGREYLAFVMREGISPEGLVDASEDIYTEFTDKDLERYTMRTREMHDLWHVITGYGRDGLGEMCVVSFSYAQTKNLGFGAIALMAAYQFSRLFPRRRIFRTAWEAYRIGRKAAWFPSQDWETLMEKPLKEVRVELKVIEPSLYHKADDIIDQTRPETFAQLIT